MTELSRETVKALVNAGLDGMVAYAKDHETSDVEVVNALMNMAGRGVAVALGTSEPVRRAHNIKAVQDTLQKLILQTLDDMAVKQ